MGIVYSVASVLRSLIFFWPFSAAMAGRELKSINKGAILGVAWLIIRPLFQVAVIVTLIAFIFKIRLGNETDAFDYALHILSGLVAWQALQRPLEEAPSLIRDRMEMIKQVIYPVETLPVTMLLQGALAPAVGMVIYLTLAAFAGKLAWTAVLLPVPVAILIVLVLGASWVMMIVGVVLKDLREFVSVVLGLLMYLSPVLLTEEIVGERMWGWVLLNPLAHVIIAFRDVLEGAFHAQSWIIFSAMAVFCFVVGSWVIHRMKTRINEYI